MRFIDIELDHCKYISFLSFLNIIASEETIFRQNSIVTRMFKYYSRMVGTEYLFHTLARYVAEIEASSRMSKTGTNY